MKWKGSEIMQEDKENREDRNFALTMPKDKKEIINAVIGAIIIIVGALIAVYIF